MLKFTLIVCDSSQLYSYNPTSQIFPPGASQPVLPSTPSVLTPKPWLRVKSFWNELSDSDWQDDMSVWRKALCCALQRHNTASLSKIGPKHIWQGINLKKLLGVFDVRHLKPLQKLSTSLRGKKEKSSLLSSFLILKTPWAAISLISALCSRPSVHSHWYLQYTYSKGVFLAHSHSVFE